MLELGDKTAVVTGAASGIGLAVAKRLTTAGAHVVLLDIQREAGEAAARQVAGRFIGCDVSDCDQVREAMDAAAEQRGRIDIVVNNAGIALANTSIIDTTLEHFRAHMNVNAGGVLNGIRFSAPHMTNGGAIVNTSSLAGVLGLPGYGSYAASKFAVVGLTKIAAIELGPKGIRVNCVCPTTVDTPMLRDFPDGEQEARVLSASSTLGRIIDADHVAALVHFLAADDCPVISGQAVLIDCGITSGVSETIWQSSVGATA